MNKIVLSGVLAALFAVASPIVAAENTQATPQYELYGKIGFPHLTFGAGYGINEKLTVRGELGTLGSISRDFDEGDVKYSAKLRNNKANFYADYFPLGNGLRLTGGLSFGRTEVKASGHSRLTGKQTFEIGGQGYKVNLDSNDSVSASVKFPAVSPYLGFGWGHNIKNAKSGSWGFTADLGIFIGGAKTNIHVSDGLNQKLVEAQAKLDGAGASLSADQRAKAQNEVDSRIEAEKRKIKDRIGGYKVVPMISLGATYRF